MILRVIRTFRLTIDFFPTGYTFLLKWPSYLRRFFLSSVHPYVPMVYTSRMKVAFLCNIVVFHFGYSTIQRKLNSSIMAKVAPRTEKKEIAAAAEDSRISCTIKKRGGRERGSRDQLCKLYRGKRNIFNAEMMLLQFLAFNDNIRNK